MRCPLSKTFWNSARRRSRRPLPNCRDATSKPGLTWAGLTCGRLGGIRSGRGNREALAALRPAALQHQTPILGAHAHEKTMGASPALAVRLKRTLHVCRSPATDEYGRRNLDNNEPWRRVSIDGRLSAALSSSSSSSNCGSNWGSNFGGFVRVESVCYSRLPCGTVGSPPEVFHNCGKKCGKATVFAPLLEPESVVTRVSMGRRPQELPVFEGKARSVG